MGKFLLDYAFPISLVEALPAANTGFLKQAILICKPKAGQESNVGQAFLCTTMTQVAARTDNDEAEQFFNAGHSRIYILLANDLGLSTFFAANPNLAYTAIISSDFTDAELEMIDIEAVAASRKIQDILYTAVEAGTDGNAITVSYVDDQTDGSAQVSVVGSAITVGIESGVTTADDIATAIEADTDANVLVTVDVDVGDESDPQVATGGALALQNGAEATDTPGDVDFGIFDGVIAYSTDDATVADVFAALDKHCAFFTKSANGAKNMVYAFGSLLSNAASWKNQQYITMPVNDDVDTLGEATALFDERISFVASDEDYGNRLAFFAAGGKAIVAPYIIKQFRIELQAAATSWIALNQPAYTNVNAVKLSNHLRTEVLEKKFINTGLIETATVTISIVNDNFVATGLITASEPRALWRVANEMLVG